MIRVGLMVLVVSRWFSRMSMVLYVTIRPSFGWMLTLMYGLCGRGVRGIVLVVMIGLVRCVRPWWVVKWCTFGRRTWAMPYDGMG